MFLFKCSKMTQFCHFYVIRLGIFAHVPAVNFSVIPMLSFLFSFLLAFFAFFFILFFLQKTACFSKRGKESEKKIENGERERERFKKTEIQWKSFQKSKETFLCWQCSPKIFRLKKIHFKMTGSTWNSPNWTKIKNKTNSIFLYISRFVCSIIRNLLIHVFT